MITDPNHLFYPKDAIKGENAEYFYGRDLLLRKCLDALGSRGTSCVIYGDRGVGKTSLAWQVATILDDTNKKYVKHDLMRIGTQDKYKCVFHRVKSGIESLGDLLISLLRPSRSPNSLQSLFPELYEDKNIYTKFERKYKINLPTLISFEATFDSQKRQSEIATIQSLNASQEQNILHLFEDVLIEILNLNPELQLIFFIDEIDQAPIKTGLGGLIKNTNDARFVFIGIANSISDIIEDHASAGRKLISGDIEVPALMESDIRQIFTSATKKSDGGVVFAEEFMDLAFKYSAGYPWIAQNIGFQAVLAKLPTKTLIQIESSDFKSTISKVMGIYERDELNRPLSFESIYDGSTTRQILEYLWTLSVAPTTDDIQEKGVSPNVSRFVPNALNRLVELKILKKNSSNRWQFTDPVIRILWRAYSDKIDWEN